MDKINFQNLPNTTTPVNAANLNQLQTNVENAISEIEEENWQNITFNTNWENVGGNYPTAQYKKVQNQVFIRGLVKNDVGGGSGLIIATLPSGYRPKKITYIDKSLSIYIASNGNIYIDNYTMSSWVLISANFFID